MVWNGLLCCRVIISFDSLSVQSINAENMAVCRPRTSCEERAFPLLKTHMSVCLDILSLQWCWEIVDILFCHVDRGNHCFSRLFQHVQRLALFKVRHTEVRRDSAEDKDITKEDAKTGKDLCKKENKKKRLRLFSMLLLCFVNVPAFLSDVKMS